MGKSGPLKVESFDLRVYKIPTSQRPESDGTLRWDHTTTIVVRAACAGNWGIGYTYSHPAAASVIEQTLIPLVSDNETMAVGDSWWHMRRAVRNFGDHGIAATAIAAVDLALWDLKARVLGVSLADLLGPLRREIPLYASGGFTSESIDELCAQLGGWAADGFTRVKMKVGRDLSADPERVRAARNAIGPSAELFVDANAAYTPKQAHRMAQEFAESRVAWLEEPVSSDNLAELRQVRQRAPALMAVAAGEYHFAPRDAQEMLDAAAVDVMQVDVTRCMGISGLLNVQAMCTARSIPLSLHTAPAAHAHVATALSGLEHLEYFHDHVRIEQMLFDGVPTREGSSLVPNRECLGNGLSLRVEDASRYEC